ncbi:MAG TPA: bacteriocin fulvocin C-related protein, partial [Steroidobacteraceae bacterium]|nr:bacteriocin fulvocin C-related protein [Steroidobacteraceae bacterium]
GPMFTQRRALVSLTLALALLASLAAATGLDRTPACQRAAAWVTAHASELPTTLEDIAKHPRPIRIAIFNALPYEVRSALWHDQLKRFRQTHRLNSTQEQLVTEALTIITPEMYRRRVEGMTPDQEYHHAREHTAFAERATKAFDRQTLRVFGELGWVIEPIRDSPRFGLMPARLTLTAMTIDCDCYSQSDFCSLDCLKGYQNCTPQPTGCGWFNCEPCDGTCIPWP